MKKNYFWIMSALTLIIISAAKGLNPFLRVALLASSLVLIIDIIKRIGGIRRGRNKKA